MSDIALYEVLTKLGVEPKQAKEAIGGVASAATKSDIKDMATKSDIKDMATKSDIKDMATKSDIKDMATKSDIKDMATKSDLVTLAADINTKIANLETRLVKHTYSMAGLVVAAIVILKYL